MTMNTSAKDAERFQQFIRAMQGKPYACLALPDDSNRVRVKVEIVGGREVMHEYAYDEAGRLAMVRRDGNVTEEYAYDELGRRSEDRCQAWGMQQRRHEYGPDDRLLRTGDATFEYDDAGRLKRRKEPGRGDFICRYTPLGFLGVARLPDLRWISYDRDGECRRTARRVDNRKVESYGWDRQGRLEWFFNAMTGETSWFEYGGDDERLPASMQCRGKRYTLGWDQAGSLRAVIDGQGEVVKEIDYDAFGFILTETAPEMRIPFGFAGGLQDRDTGLIRYRFRDYVPDIGRFTAKDPIGCKGGDGALRGYGLGDPVNGMHPGRKSGGGRGQGGTEEPQPAL